MGVRPFLSRKFGSPEANLEVSAEGPAATAAAHGVGREAGALLLFALSVFLSAALAGYEADPNDPRVRGSDWVGPVGALVAQGLVHAVGVIAWLVPLELALVGAPLFRGAPPQNPGQRLAGDLVVGIVLAALVQVAYPDAIAFGQARASGSVGLLFGELLSALFSTAGSFLVGSTSVLLILIGRSSFSFIETCQRGLTALRRFSSWFMRGLSRASEIWRDASELRRQEAEAAASRSEPRIDTAGGDEAIVAELALQDSDWFPAVTGTPPAAVAVELSAAFSKPARRLTLESEPENQEPFDVDEEENEEGEPASSEEAPPKVQKKPAGRAAAPTIVDTKPAQQVERQARPLLERPRLAGQFRLPSLDLFEPAEAAPMGVDRERILENAAQLEKTLADYGVAARVEEIHPGPTVTTYEVVPEAGTKVSKVASLCDDLALGLSRKVRIIAPIPGKKRIGFELPNDHRVPVNLRELLEDRRFTELSERAALPVVLGRDIVGAPFYADLAAMPHVIVAGATGAGKSVGLNVMLSSLLTQRTPDELRLLMVDPKVVELAPFDGIPHLLLPVVTDMKQAATALKWGVDEMERRYQLFASAGTRNITSYNEWADRVQKGELPAPRSQEVEALSPEGDVVTVKAAAEGTDGQSLPGKLPFIVIVVDEFADLMMQQGKEVEVSVARLAQKARAAGMHVVLATQRPSVDVITGMIKANFPSRIAFRVAQKVDSRTILDEQGAELLLGKGDMLVKANGAMDTRRVQCPFVSEGEVRALTDYLRSQGAPSYHAAILDASDDDLEDRDEDLDARFDEAVRIVAETGRCSTSWLQRKMTIGYNRAAKMVEAMEHRGIVGPPNGSKDREVFAHPH